MKQSLCRLCFFFDFCKGFQIFIMKIIIPTFVKKYKFYVITTSALLIWVTFFDGSNLIAQFRLWQKLNNLRDEKEFYTQQLQQVRQEEKEVMGNAKAMGKFAREKYLMKKEGETIFVIVDEENKNIEEKN
jgi:cell division protein DivIC